MSRTRTVGTRKTSMREDGHYNLGWLAQSYGKYRSAIAHYRRSIKATNYYKAHYNLGTIWLARRRYRDAVDAFRAAIKGRPDFSEAYNNLGVAYGWLGERRKALAAYAKAAGLDPYDPTAFVNLGLALGRTGQRRRARALLRKALRLAPGDVDTRRWVGYALIECELAVADGIRLLEAVRRRRPKDGLVLADLAMGYSRSGMVQKAKRLVRQAKSVAPNDTVVRQQTRRVLVKEPLMKRGR